MRPIPHDRHVALEDHRRYPGCEVMLACEACGYSRTYQVAKVALRLLELRAGNTGTPVSAVARHVRRRCPRCSEVRWRSQFAYPDGMDPREVKRLTNRYRN